MAHSIVEKDNQIFSLDYTRDGKQFATAGMDQAVRVYDEKQKKVVHTFAQSLLNNCGHTNRIFCVRFKPDNENILVSGSWDNTVQIWDIRTEKAQRVIYGPHIAGDTIDIQNDVMLTGSWSDKNTI